MFTAIFPVVRPLSSARERPRRLTTKCIDLCIQEKHPKQKENRKLKNFYWITLRLKRDSQLHTSSSLFSLFYTRVHKEIKGRHQHPSFRANKIISNIICVHNRSTFGSGSQRSLKNEEWWSQFMWVIGFVVYRRASKRSLGTTTTRGKNYFMTPGRSRDRESSSCCSSPLQRRWCFLTNSSLSLTLHPIYIVFFFVGFLVEFVHRCNKFQLFIVIDWLGVLLIFAFVFFGLQN